MCRVGAAASFVQFLVSSVSPGAAAPPLLTRLTNCLSWGALIDFCEWVSSLSCLYSCGVCAGCTAEYCAGSCSCCAQWGHSSDLFPKSAVFALVLGISVRGWGLFTLALGFPGCAGGVAFYLHLPVLRLGRRLRWLALRFFAASLIPGCPCVVVWVLWMRWSCVFPLSSCFAQGRRLLRLLLGFASVPLPAAPAVFRGVSCCRFPFGGYATFLAPYACPAPAVELCLWGLRCL